MSTNNTQVSKPQKKKKCTYPQKKKKPKKKQGVLNKPYIR